MQRTKAQPAPASMRAALQAAIRREPRRRLLIAYLADVAVRTVDSYLAGRPVTSSTQRRIEQAFTTSSSGAGPSAAA